MFEDSEVSMQGLVLDCAICHRMMVYPIHREEHLNDWHHHGRLCLKCIIRLKYSEEHLEGYIVESQEFAKLFNLI